MGVYAFWEYDQFPYVLGAEVVEFQGEQVKVKGYQNYLFSPVKIVDAETGKRMQAELQALKNERDALLKSIQEEYSSKAQNILSLT